MSKELEKPIKAFICAVVGLLITALLGQPNSITVSVTAILVIGTGQNTSRYGVRIYAGRRIAIQFVDMALMVTSLWMVKRYTTLPDWIAVFIAAIIPMAVVLYLDYRFKISPMYITSISVSGLIMLTGAIKTWQYPLIRIVLVASGCLLGYVVSVWVMPRNLTLALRKACDGARAVLLEGAHLGLAGDMAGVRTCAAKGQAMLQAAQTDMSALKAEAHLRRYADDRAALPDLEQQFRCLWELLRLLQLWSDREDRFCQVNADFRTRWCETLEALLWHHTQPGGQANLPLLNLSVQSDTETILAGGLVAYWESLWKLCEETPQLEHA